MDADVIVVGAGPVGLMLAAELTLAGARPLVLETLAGPSGNRKARGVGPLGAEALHRRGLGDEIAVYREAALESLRRDHGTDKAHFAHIHKIDRTLMDEPERGTALIWQPDLERVLGGYADRLGVRVCREHTVTDLEQDDEGVTVTVRTPAGERLFRAPYLVGCDGGRSAVRGLAGFDFPGTQPIMTTVHAPADLDDPDKLASMRRTPTGAVMVGLGGVGTIEFDRPQPPRGTPVTAEELQASLRRVSGTDVTVTAVHGPGMRVTDYAAQAADYRSGRVLLAGDAAHVHSPNGGQGLNLGVMDAVNLGWKLAATVRGTAPAGLLDTYTTERHPVGEKVISNTLAQSALLRPGPHSEALREIVSDLMDIPDVNRYFGRMMTSIATRYPVAPEVTDPHPMLGQHCPDLDLTTDTGATRLSARTVDGGTILLAPAADPAVAAEAAAWSGRVHVVPVLAIDHKDLTGALIRPDGIIAWTATADRPADPATLRAALTRWLGDPA